MQWPTSVVSLYHAQLGLPDKGLIIMYNAGILKNKTMGNKRIKYTLNYDKQNHYCRINLLVESLYTIYLKPTKKNSINQNKNQSF